MMHLPNNSFFINAFLCIYLFINMQKQPRDVDFSCNNLLFSVHYSSKFGAIFYVFERHLEDLKNAMQYC